MNDASIEQLLCEDSCSFEFFQAVALLQRLRPQSEPVGRFSKPEDEEAALGRLARAPDVALDQLDLATATRS